MDVSNKSYPIKDRVMKLDFTGLNQAQLNSYQELFITTISRLKQGLFNYEASLGLNDSIKLLSDFHLQTSVHLREMKEKLAEIPVTTEMVDANEVK